MKYAIGLRILKASKNNIGKSLASDAEGEIFENTVSLEFLDLSYNNIFYLSASVFKNMQKLRTLNLQNNQLSSWRVKVDHMKNMKYINLKQNKLTAFDKKIQSLFW